MNSTCDALIIGGGPGGATAALLLARAGWSVAVIEKAAFPRGKVCGEFLSATNLPLLRELGVAEDFRELAGPEVRQVGLFAREVSLVAAMPRPANGDDAWGRALGRERLDTLLLERAAAAGAEVWQPWSAIVLSPKGGEFVCQASSRQARQSREIRARIVIAAHGSWEGGSLPSHCPRRAPRPADLFGFKAHFRNCGLRPGLMPLLVFPGGYGGMVHSDHGRVSLSCCIRRDRLEQVRRAHPRASAGDAVLAHIQGDCRGVREALSGATREQSWLSAGPIRPGSRQRAGAGIFLVGNAAGEAHPIVAEGISMAMQSAWLLCERLVRGGTEALAGRDLAAIGRDYATAWRQQFAPRIYAAALFAHLAMRPVTAAAALAIIRRFPDLLTMGARWSGKVSQISSPPRRHGH